MSYSEDEMFNFTYRAYSKESIFLPDRTFYYYRTQRKGSAMNSFNFIKRFNSFKTICIWLKTEQAQGVFKDSKFRLYLYFYYMNTLLNEMLKQKCLIKSFCQLRKSGLLKLKVANIMTDEYCFLFFKLKKNINLVFSLKKFAKKRFLEISQFIYRKFLKKKKGIKSIA